MLVGEHRTVAIGDSAGEIRPAPNKRRLPNLGCILVIDCYPYAWTKKTNVSTDLLFEEKSTARVEANERIPRCREGRKRARVGGTYTRVPFHNLNTIANTPLTGWGSSEVS